MNVQILKSHLDADPDERGYSAMNDVQVVTDLHTKRRVGPAAYTIKGVTSELGMDVARRLVATLEAAASTDALVRHMLKLLEGGETIDLGNAATRAMLDALATNEQLPLTAGDATEIKALAEDLLSDAEHYGLGDVKPGHVAMARTS